MFTVTFVYFFGSYHLHCFWLSFLCVSTLHELFVILQYTDTAACHDNFWLLRCLQPASPPDGADAKSASPSQLRRHIALQRPRVKPWLWMMPHRDFVPPCQPPDNLRPTHIPQVELPEEFSFHRQYRVIDYQSDFSHDSVSAPQCASATSSSPSATSSSGETHASSSHPQVEVGADVLTPTKPGPSPNMPAKRPCFAGKTLPKGFKPRGESQASTTRNSDIDQAGPKRRRREPPQEPGHNAHVSRLVSSSSSSTSSSHVKRSVDVPPTTKRSSLEKPAAEHVHPPKQSVQTASASSKSVSSVLSVGDSSAQKASQPSAPRPSDSPAPRQSGSSIVDRKTDDRQPATPPEEKLERSSPPRKANLFPDFVPSGPMFTTNVLPATPPIGVDATKWFVFRVAARDVMLKNDYSRRCGNYVSPQVRFAVGNLCKLKMAGPIS